MMIYEIVGSIAVGPMTVTIENLAYSQSEFLLYYKNQIIYLKGYIDSCKNIDKENNEAIILIELYKNQEKIVKEELKNIKVMF